MTATVAVTATTAAAAAASGAHNYWATFQTLLSAALAKRGAGSGFGDEERLSMDLGFVPGVSDEPPGKLLAELGGKGMSGCYYLTEWLAERHKQLQLENAIVGAGAEGGADGDGGDSSGSQLGEARRRILSRLSGYFVGLPGVPPEVSGSMISGDLDRVVIAAGITAMRDPTRKNFLRRHQFSALREQMLSKARARADGQAALKLFEMLGDVYARDWRARFEVYQGEAEEERAERSRSARLQAAQTAAAAAPAFAAAAAVATASVSPVPQSPPASAPAAATGGRGTLSLADPNAGALLVEAREMRMRTVLMAAVDGGPEADAVLRGNAPRVTKQSLAEFLPVAQTFDRALAELPPVVIVPGSGRGIFAWEAGCLILALRPMVGVDDSAATALALFRMIDDALRGNGALRRNYETTFPGAVFENDFPADYRAWLTRLTKGDAHAMSPERRAFFRDVVGPDTGGVLLPPNLRNVGPQTMSAIRRRLEKQVSADAADANLHRRLAAVYWRQNNMQAAGLQFAAAMRAAPDDGETLFAAGMFMRARGDAGAASACFRRGRERAPASMWALYCHDALENQI